jgi:hypothetical protein
MYRALPQSFEYYGNSVAIRLAPSRRSRLCAQETYLVRVGAPFASFPCSFPGTHRREPERPVVYSSLYAVSSREGCCDGCRISPLEARVQPLQASPLSCVQDLRNGSTSIPSGPSAKPPGSFPDRGFPSRLVGCPKAGAGALNLLPLWGNLMCAETAHHNNRDGISKSPEASHRRGLVPSHFTPLHKIRYGIDMRTGSLPSGKSIGCEWGLLPMAQMKSRNV